MAVGACFFGNAVLYANLIPRLPEVKADLGLSNAALGPPWPRSPSARSSRGCRRPR